MNAKFKEAAERVKSRTKRPSDSELLELYALFKQATGGDVIGSKPGLFDIKGKKKYEAWSKLKGTAQEVAANRYIAFVETLEKR